MLWAFTRELCFENPGSAMINKFKISEQKERADRVGRGDGKEEEEDVRVGVGALLGVRGVDGIGIRVSRELLWWVVLNGYLVVLEQRTDRRIGGAVMWRGRIWNAGFQSWSAL